MATTGKFGCEMSDLLVVLVDGSVELEFDRDKTVPDQQLSYLDKMDAKMDAGITVGMDYFADPDDEQKAKFVSIALATALQNGDDGTIAAMCTYLAIRRSDLKQVLITDSEAGRSVDLDYNNVYEKPEAAAQPITFNPTPH